MGNDKNVKTSRRNQLYYISTSEVCQQLLFFFVGFGLPNQQKNDCGLGGARGTNPHPHPRNHARTARNNRRADSPDEPRRTNNRQARDRNATPTERQTGRTASTAGRTRTSRKPRRTRTANEEQRKNERTNASKQHKEHPQKSLIAFWQFKNGITVLSYKSRV